MEGFETGYAFRKLEERIETLENILNQIIKTEEKDEKTISATKRTAI